MTWIFFLTERQAMNAYAVLCIYVYIEVIGLYRMFDVLAVC